MVLLILMFDTKVINNNIFIKIIYLGTGMPMF